jgi:hypothetical protein
LQIGPCYTGRLGPYRCMTCCSIRCDRSEAELAACNDDKGGADSAKGHGVGALMGMVVGRGTTAGIGVLPVDPLAIQSGWMTVLALIGVDSGHGGSDCALGGICSGVRIGDSVVGVGVLKPKSMVALEKGLAGARTAVIGEHAMVVASAGSTTEAGKGVAVGVVSATRADARVTTTIVVFDVDGTTVLMADAYAAMVTVSHAVGVADVGAGGNAVAVAVVGAAVKAVMGAAVTGAGTTATAGTTSVAATTAEGNTDSEATSAMCGGVACGDGANNDGGSISDHAGCQGRGSRLSLANRALLASTL